LNLKVRPWYGEYQKNAIFNALDKSQEDDSRKTVVIIEKLGDPEEKKSVIEFIKMTLSKTNARKIVSQTLKYVFVGDKAPLKLEQEIWGELIESYQ